jgi:hypothetical protein
LAPRARVKSSRDCIATDSLMVTVKSPEEEDSRLPSLSLLAVVSLLGMISVLRRR